LEEPMAFRSWPAPWIVFALRSSSGKLTLRSNSRCRTGPGDAV
jgi:hypothetical protein